MKKLTSLTAITLLASQMSFADPVVISRDLSLLGFSGGACNITVNATSAATSIDLDNPEPGIDVGTVNTQCDFPYRLSVTSNNRSPSGMYSLVGSTSNEFVEYEVRVDGFPVDSTLSSAEIGGGFAPGQSMQMPVQIDLMGPAPSPGAYQGALTFSVIID